MPSIHQGDGMNIENRLEIIAHLYRDASFKDKETREYTYYLCDSIEFGMSKGLLIYNASVNGLEYAAEYIKNNLQELDEEDDI